MSGGCRPRCVQEEKLRVADGASLGTVEFFFLYNNSSSCWRGGGSLVRFSTAVMTTMAVRQIADSSEGRPVSVGMYLKLGLGRGRGRGRSQSRVVVAGG